MARAGKAGVQKTAIHRGAQPKIAAATAPVDHEEAEIVDELQAEISQPMPAATPPIEKIDRGYSPMAAFGLKKRSPAPNNLSGSPAPGNVRCGPPQKLVYFEKEGIGTVPAFFHDVLVSTTPTDDDSLEESGFMVLIYDLRFEQNAARWFPPANDPYQRPWAIQINEDSKLYLVHTTGFQYVYDSREYCILLVERAVMSPGN